MELWKQLMGTDRPSGAQPQWLLRQNFGEALENDFWMASKRFWSTIQRLRGGKWRTVNTVYAGDGALLTSTRDVVSR